MSISPSFDTGTLRIRLKTAEDPGSYKYLITALGKEIIAAGLTVKNLILVPALAS